MHAFSGWILVSAIGAFSLACKTPTKSSDGSQVAAATNVFGFPAPWKDLLEGSDAAFGFKVDKIGGYFSENEGEPTRALTAALIAGGVAPFESLSTQKIAGIVRCDSNPYKCRYYRDGDKKLVDIGNAEAIYRALYRSGIEPFPNAAKSLYASFDCIVEGPMVHTRCTIEIIDAAYYAMWYGNTYRYPEDNEALAGDLADRGDKVQLDKLKAVDMTPAGRSREIAAAFKSEPSLGLGGGGSRNNIIGEVARRIGRIAVAEGVARSDNGRLRFHLTVVCQKGGDAYACAYSRLGDKLDGWMNPDNSKKFYRLMYRSGVEPLPNEFKTMQASFDCTLLELKGKPAERSSCRVVSPDVETTGAAYGQDFSYPESNDPYIGATAQ